MKASARVIRCAAAVAGLASLVVACVPADLPETALPIADSFVAAGPRVSTVPPPGVRPRQPRYPP